MFCGISVFRDHPTIGVERTGLDLETSVKQHVELRTTGQLESQVPEQWLMDSSLRMCPVCSRLISTKTRLGCPRCYPIFHNPVSQFKQRPPQPDTPDLQSSLDRLEGTSKRSSNDTRRQCERWLEGARGGSLAETTHPSRTRQLPTRSRTTPKTVSEEERAPQPWRRRAACLQHAPPGSANF